MIKLKNLSLNLEKFKLANINLEIRENEYFVILGPSGAGKTILLELIAGVRTPESGSIIVKGEDITYHPPEERGVSIVYQDYMLFPHQNVFENVAFGLRVKGLDNNLIRGRVDKILETFEISHLRDRKPYSLSGGEKQKTALARALITKPNILLLDEPLSALHESVREKLMDELGRINKEFNVTIIHVTHNFKEALRLADRIAVMDKGRIMQVGDPEEIFRKPRTKFVADFVRVKNMIKGVAKKHEDLTKVETGNIEIYSSSNVEGEVFAIIRPEDVTISKSRANTSALNEFRGVIKAVEYENPLVQLKVDVGETFTVYLTRKSFLDMNINVGSPIWIQFKASSVHLLQY